MQNRKKHILVDMDETVAYLHKYCLQQWNRDYPNKPMTFADLPTWDSGAVFMEYFQNGDTYRNLEVIPQSQHVIAQWVKQGHLITFVTASPQIAECQQAKSDWIDNYFPFVGSKNIVFTDKKGSLGGDMLIDDSPTYLSQFKHGLAVKHNRQYNLHVPSDISFSHWNEIVDLPFRQHEKLNVLPQSQLLLSKRQSNRKGLSL